MSVISRRDFLSRSAYAGAGAVALTALPRASWANPLGLPIGIQLYAVSKPLHDDPAGTLKELYSVGYREVESAGPQAGMSVEAFRKLIDDAGLKFPSCHLQLAEGDLGPQFDQAHAMGAHFAVSSVLRAFSPEFMKAAKAAMDSGGKIPMPKMAPMGPDDFKRTAERMNVVGNAAKAAGLQYAYHNHNFEFVKMPDGKPGYDILLKETDPELVKFEVDCGWMVVAGGSPAAYFAKYPGRFRMLHIKDFKPVAAPTTDLMGKGRPLGTDLGTGFIDYGPIFAAAKGKGIQHIFVEQEAPFAVSQMASAKVDFAYLRKWS